jgi:hypothetical protein
LASTVETEDLVMPFTQEEFFQVFALYNAAMWPLQILFYVAGVAAVALTYRQSRASTATISFVLALMWMINGVAYHWSFFAAVNPIARGFAVLFMIEALLLLAAPFLWPSFRIEARRDSRTFVGLGMAAFAAIAYPILGYLAGHNYPAVPVFGIAPCPTTIFTMGILLLGPWKVARWLLILPGLWSLIGGSAAVLLDVPQDFGLIAAFLIVLGFAVAMALGSKFALHIPNDI